jgi:hypothetical protein
MCKQGFFGDGSWFYKVSKQVGLDGDALANKSQDKSLSAHMFTSFTFSGPFTITAIYKDQILHKLDTSEVDLSISCNCPIQMQIRYGGPSKTV